VGDLVAGGSGGRWRGADLAGVELIEVEMGLIASLKRGVSRRSGSINDPTVSISDALADEGLKSLSGESVSAKKALSIAAVYQAVSMISGDVAKLPMGVWRRQGDGGRSLFREHHAFNRINLVGMANPEINAFKFWRRLLVSALLWNNGYAWIDKNGRGEVLGLYNLLPDRTAPMRIRGQLYFVTEVGGQLEPLPADQVFHIEGLSLDGMAGENLIKLFRDLFGAALAKRKFTSKFFSNGMTAGGVLTVPPGAKPEAVHKVQAGLKEKFSNTDNAFKTLVLRDGFKWYSTQVDPKDAELTDSIESDAREVSRIFNIRASRLSVAGSTSYNSDENATRDYYDGTLSHWLIANRCEANAKLRTPAEREDDQVYLDYNINALMWADSKTRSEIANAGILNGRFSPNETRSWENLNPYEGGDEFYRPLNVGLAGQPDPDDPAHPPEPDEDDTTEDDSPDDQGNRSAAVRLAEATLTRAENRLKIKASRAKHGWWPEAVDADRSAVVEMISDACEVLGRGVDGEWDRLREAALKEHME
jgi:HK97 family phage portal protein